MGKEKIKRFGRGMGSSGMGGEQEKSENVEDLEKVQKQIMNEWLMGNGMVCGIMYDINRL